MRLVFLGPPGAGKGTQAEILSEKTGLPHVSPGDVFRKAVRDGTPLGRRAKEYMDAGRLVPDDITVGIIKEKITSADCSRGFILDGFPRNIKQAEALEQIMAETGLRIDAAVDFHVSTEVLIERSVGRRVCRSCGATYHVKHNPSRRGDLCEVCGGPLVQRDDDREETVMRRLAVYEEQTAPLVEFYRRKGLLRRVNGDQPLASVTAEVGAVLSDLGIGER